MKAIKFEIKETPNAGTIDENGDFGFYLYTSNACDGEFEEAIESLILLWAMPTDISLKIHMKLKDVYMDLYEMYNESGKIGKKDEHRFESLKKDCQWIIDQINLLEKNT